MHRPQPQPLRFPSYTELYGRPFEVLAFCWATVVLLFITTAGAKALAVVATEFLWFGLDPVWAAAAEALAHTFGVASLVISPGCLVLMAVLFPMVQPMDPKLLPPWTTRERLRQARALIRDRALSDDPWTDLLARSYADVRVRWGAWVMNSSLANGHLVLCCLLSVGGVFMMLEAQDPAALTIGLYVCLFFLAAGAANLVLRPEIRRMRDFCHLYDSAYHGGNVPVFRKRSSLSAWIQRRPQRDPHGYRVAFGVGTGIFCGVFVGLSMALLTPFAFRNMGENTPDILPLSVISGIVVAVVMGIFSAIPVSPDSPSPESRPRPEG